jgi:hypothetical protein
MVAAARRRGETDFSRWRAGAEPLPLSHIIRIEAKRYSGSWQPLDPQRACVRDGAGVHGILLGDIVYTSVQCTNANLSNY